eukprot:jgi/Botrbrau1/10704/Bobra.357_1s0007.1
MIGVRSDMGGQWRRLLIAASRANNLSSSLCLDRTLSNAVNTADRELSPRGDHRAPPTPAFIASGSRYPLLQPQYSQACQSLQCTTRGASQSFRRYSQRSSEDDYNVIEAEPELVRIDSYNEDGFVVNGTSVEGPILCTRNFWTHWAVPNFEALSQDSLAMVDLIKPIPDMVVIGCGGRMRMLPPDLRAWLSSRGIGLEAIDTANAVGLFNVLNQEGRIVVGGLLPSSL